MRAASLHWDADSGLPTNTSNDAKAVTTLGRPDSLVHSAPVRRSRLGRRGITTQARGQRDLVTDTVAAYGMGAPHRPTGHLGVERLPEPWPSPSALARLRSRDFVTLTLLFVNAVASLLVAADSGGAVRGAVVLTASLTAPGWAVVAHLDLRWPAAEVALTLAASLAILLVVALLMVSARTWHPTAAWLAVSGLATIPLAARLRLAYLARGRTGAGEEAA